MPLSMPLSVCLSVCLSLSLMIAPFNDKSYVELCSHRFYTVPLHIRHGTLVFIPASHCIHIILYNCHTHVGPFSVHVWQARPVLGDGVVGFRNPQFGSQLAHSSKHID